MDEGFQAEKAEQAFQKKINTLQTELDELRATFGKELMKNLYLLH